MQPTLGDETRKIKPMNLFNWKDLRNIVWVVTCFLAAIFLYYGNLQGACTVGVIYLALRFTWLDD